MYDSYADGWNGGTYTITDVTTGLPVATGGLVSGAYGQDALCLPDGCYEVVVGGGLYPGEISFDFAVLVGSPVGTYLVAVGTGVCPVYGCTDPTAVNYNALADTDDGSCFYNDVLTLTLSDQYDDGWDYFDGSQSILTIDGVVYGDTYIDGQPIDFALCLDMTGCYDVIFTPANGWYSENAWSISDASGVIASGGYGTGNPVDGQSIGS